MRRLIASLVMMGVAGMAQADFADDFDAAGALSSVYSYAWFQNTAPATTEGGSGVDSWTATAGNANFTLNTGGSQVDVLLPDPLDGATTPGSFGSLRITRDGDPSNQYDINQGATLTLNASGLDAQFFGGQRNPVGFGFSNGADEVKVMFQLTNFTPITEVNGKVNGGNNTVQAFGQNPNNQDLILNIDADSYSVFMGATEVIPDTVHGITWTGSAIPFMEAQHVFNGGATDYALESFSGTGTIIPEPSTALLALLGLGLLVRRRYGK